MRIKAIPAEAVEAVSKNPLLIVGAVAALGAGYYFVARTPNVASVEQATDPSPSYASGYGLAPLSTGGIVTYPNAASTGGIVDSVSNSAALAVQAAKDAAAAAVGKVTDKDLFDFEVLKNSQSFDLAKMSMAQNLAIASLNADIAWQGIQSANYSTSAGLAQAFLLSGSSLSMGAIVAPDGSVTKFGLTSYTPDSSKKGKETTRYQSVLASSGLADFLASTSAPSTKANDNAAFSGTGSVTASPHASLYAPSPVQSGGGSIAEALADSPSNYRGGAGRSLYGDSVNLA